MHRDDTRLVGGPHDVGHQELVRGIARGARHHRLGEHEQRQPDDELRVGGEVREEVAAVDVERGLAIGAGEDRHWYPCDRDQQQRTTEQVLRTAIAQAKSREHAVDQVAVEQRERDEAAGVQGRRQSGSSAPLR